METTRPLSISLAQIAVNIAPWVLGNDTPRRAALWVAGCSLGRQGASCTGCMSTLFHEEKPTGTPISAIVRYLEDNNQDGGLIVSGGEPLDQASSVAALSREYREAFPVSPVVIYSGFGLEWIRANHSPLLDNIDVMISGPFLSHREVTSVTGSGNQRVTFHSPLGAKVYANYENWPRRFQITSQGTVIGVLSRDEAEIIQIQGVAND